MGKQKGRTIYKWKAFGKQHLFIPKVRGATSHAAAKKIARRQWKRKTLTRITAQKFNWGHPDNPVPGYVVHGDLIKKKR